MIAVLDRLERKLGSRRFREIFKAITVYNVSENPDKAGMEKSLLTRHPRTTIYCAHPYSAHDRSSNKAANCLVRYFMPKDTNIVKLSHRDVRRVERWMNEYPKRKHHYLSAYEALCFGVLFSHGCDNENCSLFFRAEVHKPLDNFYYQCDIIILSNELVGY